MFRLLMRIDDGNDCNAKQAAARDSDGVAAPPLCTYTISVTTGDRRGAGTNAHVYVELYGENGKTGERFLDTSVIAFCLFVREWLILILYL
jgi:hypothetical protein